MRLVLTRESTPGPDCTLGFLSVADLTLCTIERPWIPGIGKGGTKGISCVPKGLYRLVRHDTEAHPETWALVNEALDVVHMPGDSPSPHARTAVLIHAANFSWELRGCIAPGTRATKDEQGRPMVASSRQAMSLIRARVPWVDDTHTLEIR
jgi:hypothetical protein